MLTALCLALLGGCGSGEEPADTQEETGYWDSQSFDDLSGNEFVKVGENGKMQLLVNPSTGTIRWMDTSTGVYQDSNMIHDENLETKTNAEQSDLIIRYFNGSTNSNKLYEATASYDSYTALGQDRQNSRRTHHAGISGNQQYREKAAAGQQRVLLSVSPAQFGINLSESLHTAHSLPISRMASSKRSWNARRSCISSPSWLCVKVRQTKPSFRIMTRSQKDAA